MTDGSYNICDQQRLPVNVGQGITHLHAITGSNNQNSANSEVKFWLAIQNYELKECTFL